MKPAWWISRHLRHRPLARGPRICACGGPIKNYRARVCRACWLARGHRVAVATLLLLLGGCVTIRDSHVTIDREFSIKHEVPAREPAHQHGPQSP